MKFFLFCWTLFSRQARSWEVFSQKLTSILSVFVCKIPYLQTNINRIIFIHLSFYYIQTLFSSFSSFPFPLFSSIQNQIKKKFLKKTFAVIILIILIMDININRKKTDVCFANSLQQVKKLVRLRISLHTLETIIMSIMLPIDYLVLKTDSNDDITISFLSLALVVSLLGFIGNFSHNIFLSNTENCLFIAKQLNHVVEDEPIDPNQQQKWVSTEVYNAQTSISNAQAPPEMRALVENQLLTLIRVVALSMDTCNRFIINFTGAASFLLFIFGIVILSTEQLPTADFVVIILYVIFQFAAHFQAFVCLIIVALLPVFCIFFCIYICCCKKGQAQAKLPEAVPATIEILNKADGGDCSICFQSMILEESLIVLPCSEKHVFHDKCIISWTALKPTCPICRHDLSQ